MRPFSAEPGDDADRCDTPPHRFNDIDCDCERCQEERDLCPNCKGDGVRWEYVEGGFLEKVGCLDCRGTGRCEED
jgi:hypothetical protein